MIHRSRRLFAVDQWDIVEILTDSGSGNYLTTAGVWFQQHAGCAENAIGVQQPGIFLPNHLSRLISIYTRRGN